MNDFRNRPNDNYIQDANWQQLYVLTEHWKSDLLFYSDDLRFLHHLIDKYFMWISKRENIEIVSNIEIGLLTVDKECTSLTTKVNEHLHHLADLIDNPFTNDSHLFRTEHEQLEDAFADFVKAFRENRKEIFKITDYIIKKEDMVKQLDFSKN